MDRECQLVFRKTKQCLEQNRKYNKDSTIEIKLLKNSTENINEEEKTEFFYIKRIKKINFKNMIFKIISLGCLNHLINEKNNNETRPLLEQLNELQAKNRKEMLKANQRIAEAETIIAESSRRRYYVENTLIEQQIDEEEEFYDALDTQEWLNVKKINVSDSCQQGTINSKLMPLIII